MMASLINAKRQQLILIEMRVDTTEAVDGAEDEPLVTTQAKLVCQSTLIRLLGDWYWPRCLENGQSGGGDEYTW
jgi:hypothetical protein